VIPSQSSKTGRRKKKNSNRKGRSQTIPFYRWHIIPKRSQNLTRNLLEIINTFSKIPWYKINFVETILGMEAGGDKGKWWKGWIHVWYIWYIIRTFVSATMYPSTAINFLKKISSLSIYQQWTKWERVSENNSIYNCIKKK
jgi:hypothetical protein